MPVRPTIEFLEGRNLLSGLQATYFDNSNFTGKTVSRVDSQVDFTWSSAPISGFGADTFSVRWTGTVIPKYAEKYTFYTVSDDGVRLWVDHKLIIDNWTTHSAREDQGTITLIAGKPYDIQLEFFEQTGSATAKLKWSSKSQGKAVISTKQLTPASQNLASMLDHAMVFAASQLTRTIADLGNSPTSYVNRTSNSDGKWKVVTADDWASGFLPGAFWQMYQATGSSFWSDKARAWTLGLAGQASKTGDLAFRLLTTFRPLYNLTKDPTYRQILLDAAASKNAMWNEAVGAFRTDWRASTSGNPLANFGVLMDQTTDVELILFAARELNDPVLYDRALRHTRTVISHLIRADGGSYHWGYFNSVSGEFVGGETYQGYSNDSTWARGQAWGIYSLSTIARETAQPDILDAAQRMADYFIAHLPVDSVPFWDFNDPSIPATWRDSSAAAVVASGLLQLSQITLDAARSAGYRAAAERMLASLASAGYLAETNTISRGILLHAAQNVPNDPNGWGNDVSLIYGDYYFLEAINRYRQFRTLHL
jgi:unsaturated chondroitin disaccharide hydrolase